MRGVLQVRTCMVCGAGVTGTADWWLLHQAHVLYQFRDWKPRLKVVWQLVPPPRYPSVR